MARSTYIYIVSYIYNDGGLEIKSAYTVKHEMIRALWTMKEANYDLICVSRVRDGDSSGVVVDITDEVISS